MLALPPKAITFQLLMNTEGRARLHLRVRVHPHDDTESIIITVKNFYGIYSTEKRSIGVSLEDSQGNILIARYENFTDNMVVLVRAVEEPPIVLGAAART